MDWIRVDYLKIIMMFLSTVWTLNLTAPLTAEDSLVSKWYNALNFSKSVPIKKKQYKLNLNGLRVSTFSKNYSSYHSFCIWHILSS